MYTGLVLDLETKPDTPDPVIELLRFMIDPENAGWWPYPKPAHEFFHTNGWDWCLQGQNGYPVIGERTPSLTRPEWCSYGWYDAKAKGNAYVLSVASSIKNYWRQFPLFLDWITPYVYDGRGWIMYEEDDSPTLVWWEGDHQELKLQGPYEAAKR